MMQNRKIHGAIYLMPVVLMLALAGGCAREETPPAGGDWWELVTGVPADSLGFMDRWESPGGVGQPVAFSAHIRDGNMARLDFSLAAGGYVAIYNHGRTVCLRPAPPYEKPVDRTLLMTYLVPFLGREQLAELLDRLGIDTGVVTRDARWNGHDCIVVGRTADQVAAEGDADEAASEKQVPAIYFDAHTGAALRLITVDLSPIGVRVGDFRGVDHEMRRGAWLPKGFETWGERGRRSQLVQVEQSEGANLPAAMFVLPAELATGD